jgi:C-methyltransferase C-terminal domain/Putative zinc binding domain/Methyltransferase domain
MNKPIYSLGENINTTDYISILDLGDQPWGNDFLSTSDNSQQKKYPLHLVYCNTSELLQLNYFVPKEVMFSNHTYITTPALLKDFNAIAIENRDQFNLNPVNDCILDIGGNDGSQLLQYKNLGFNKLINFESAENISTLSEQNGVPCINKFFNYENVKETVPEKSVKLINASGIFFHLEELHSAINAINYCLQDDGILVVQFMYAGAMVENLNFDTIYHEHLCYYTVNSITKLLLKYGLYLEDGYFTELHSGSIVAKFRKNIVTQTERAKALIQSDKKYDLNAFKDFAKVIQSKKYDLKHILMSLKKNNKKIYAYGAPVKGNTLMNYMEIDNSLIDKAVEINPLKIGTYTPGSNIPVIAESDDDIPDYYLLLAHNFTKQIIAKNKDLINRGVKFIIPFPEIKIVDNNNCID